METMTVHWQKRNDYLSWERWCQLDSDLINDPRLEFRLDTPFGVIRTDIVGVYIIWAGISNRTMLKVGSGIIKNRLREHLSNPKVQAYTSKGLYATWAIITPSFKPGGELDDKERGVERFLGVWLNPKLTERLPNNVDPILVNLPEWDEPANPLHTLSKEVIPMKNRELSLAEAITKGSHTTTRSSLAEAIAKNSQKSKPFVSKLATALAKDQKHSKSV